jgi:CheY-like chemotaxis protein/anti-sigma regulatory factor (Ser/Thr protein kinase)
VKSILVVDDDRVTRHLVRGLLEPEGYAVTCAADADEALREIRRAQFDVALVDVWMPGMSGLDLTDQLHAAEPRLKVVVMTADDTSETVLQAVRRQAYRFIAKPIEPGTLLEIVSRALASPSRPPRIEVLSARPEWVELLVPCDAESAQRIQAFLAHLDADLPQEVRESVGHAFHELLMNAIEWGGRLDPGRQVRISYLRAKRMLLYRIADPGQGFSFDALTHAAVGHAADQPTGHVRVREEKGMRAGGFGLLITRALVDELIYNQAQNEVVFIKYLD